MDTTCPTNTDDEFAFFTEDTIKTINDTMLDLETRPISVNALPDLKYLESVVVPLLVPALQEVALAKPKDPIAFLAAYLISNNPQRDTEIPTPPVEYPVLFGRNPHPTAPINVQTGAMSPKEVPGQNNLRLDEVVTNNPSKTGSSLDARPNTSSPSPTNSSHRAR
eukprot:Tbor_TRINITY_DN6198_c1_g3::TRINITY_DN6198_c1_g3_i1::g.21948::m.21948